jgi:drug/metabolite transporter (DMT)-like permease
VSADTSALPASAAKPWLADFVLLASIWGGSFLMMSMAVPSFGALPTAFARVVIASLFLLPLVARRGLLGELRAHHRPIFLIGLFNSALPFALFAYAVQHLTTGLTSILNATVPLFGALVAWAWLGQRPRPAQWLGLALGFAGIALLSTWGKPGLPNVTAQAATPATQALAIAACMGATLCYALSAIAAQRFLKGIPPLVTATGSQLGATLGLLVPALWALPAQLPPAKAWLGVTVVGILCTGVAYVLYFRLIEHAGPTRAISVTYMVPVFAIVYGALFIGEPVTLRMIACGVVIALGTALTTGLLGGAKKAG